MSPKNTKNRGDDNLLDKKVKLIPYREENRVQYILKSMLNIHNHRYFRRLFCSLLIAHILILFLAAEWKIRTPEFVHMFLFISSKLWPFPTFVMSSPLTADSSEIQVINIAFKVFEITSILLYAIDLVPKIFVWRTWFIWKLVNIFVVTVMVIQVPLTMIGYLQSGENPDRLKWRVCSISLSFLLLCDVFSIREQRTLRQMKSITPFTCSGFTMRFVFSCPRTA